MCVRLYANVFMFLSSNTVVGLEIVKVRYRTYSPLTDSHACSSTFNNSLCTTRKITSQREALNRQTWQSPS